MKRIAYFILLALVLSPACGFGQGRVMYGITGGLSLGSRYEVPISSGFSSYTTGKSVGALAGFEIDYFNWDRFSYCAQILFDQKGFAPIQEQAREGLIINYIEIPLTIKIAIIHREWKPYIFVGPTFGFNFNGEAPIDVGIYGGLGISYSFSKSIDLFFQAGYAYGVEDVSPLRSDDAPRYHEYARDIRINFGILYGKE